MSDFNAVEFTGNPDIAEFKKAKINKDDLKYIAKTFNIPFTQDVRKDKLKTLILAHLGDTEAVLAPTVNDPSIMLEIKKIEMQAKKLELEFAEKENEKQRQHEMQIKQLDNDDKEKARQHNVQLQQLGAKQSQPPCKTDLLKYVKLLPSFPNDDPEAFFREFESTAKHFEIPQADWVWLIKPKLSEKALTVCNNIENNTDFDTVKGAILKAYSITTEGYRQAFRNHTKLQYQTYTEFAADKTRALKRWLKSASVSTFDKLFNLVALEEFLRRIPHSIKVHIIDREETDLLKAAQLADNYSLIHKSPTRERKHLSSNVKVSGNSGSNDKTRDGKLASNPVCFFCKKSGHVINNCPDPKCKVAKIAKTKPVASIQSMPTKVNDPFHPFRSTGTVSLGHGQPKHPVKIVRDTCAAQSLIRISALPNICNNYTGEIVYLKDFHDPFPVHLARMDLSCDLVQGAVKVGVSNEKMLPIPDADLILGNDLAGSLVYPPLIICKSPLSENPTKDLEQTQPGLLPSCAVTRSHSKAGKVNEPTLPPQSLIPTIFTEQSLKEAQQSDTSLIQLHNKAIPKDNILHPPSYYHQDGVLMRMYKPPQLNDDDTWAECHQIVLPQTLRHPIMEVAHAGLAGHLGINKTYTRLLAEFFWPGMKKDVTCFVNNCHTCQLVGKANEVIPPYPLQPIKVPSEPFQKIMIDIVGPLPKTKKGNQYILTTLCPTTRYPEAFPLRNISAKTVINTLTHMFTTFGIPQEIQSDRGSNFTSDLFTQVLQHLGIRQSLSTAYHPQSQGALERQHQTLKSMLRKFCSEEDRDWDEGLPFLLFALRETPSDSLGVSPFELLYGRKVRGPLKVIKDHLITSPTSKLITVQRYINSLQERLTKVRAFASKNLTHAQSVMKAHYDSSSQTREFKEGDLVLAYIPITGSPLQAKYHGPYKVQKKLSGCNYIIETPDRRKATQHIHINLLKPYRQQNSPDNPQRPMLTLLDTSTVHSGSSVSVAKTGIIPPTVQEPELTHVAPTVPLYNSEILCRLPQYLQHLTSSQQDDVKLLLHQYSAVFKDDPGCCHTVTHSIKLQPGTLPIKQHYYRLHPQKRTQMRKEVDYLLDHGLAVPSQSPWASPSLLVPKEDGQLRLCTDYRRVNSVTVPDAYPLPRVDDLIDEHHHQQLSRVMSRLQEADLTVKLAKTIFGQATITYLGHEVGLGVVRPKAANIYAIIQYPAPTTRKALMRFLGMAGYYRRFCPNFAQAAAPLTRMTSGAVPFVWTDDCQTAFNQLKTFLTQDPVLRSPDFSLPFVLHTDASGEAVGAALLQDREGVLHPVAYYSAKLDVHQQRYSTIEKELLSIISAIKKFECYLSSNPAPLQVFTDHNPLTFLDRNKFSNQRLLRWSLFLQPYNLQVNHIKGSDNVIADTLSRLSPAVTIPSPS